MFFARRRAVLNVQAPGSRALSVAGVKGGRSPSAVFRCAWTCIFLALLGVGPQVSAAPGVLLRFFPKYTLGAIEPKECTVENNGWAPAQFTVKVLDHKDKPVKGVEVDWVVTGAAGADKVVVHAYKTDDKGDSLVELTSREVGTFNLEASWNNGAQTASGASVTFQKTDQLEIGQGLSGDMPYKPGEVFEWPVTGGSGAPIQCTSSDESVLRASVVPDQLSCHLEMVSSGSATLTVTQAATDQYQANSASCEITLKSQCQLLYASSVFLGQQKIVVTGGGAGQKATLYVNGQKMGNPATIDTTGRAEFVLDIDAPDETLSIMVDVDGAKISGEMRVQPYPMYATPYVNGSDLHAKVTAQKLDVLGISECPASWVEDPDDKDCCTKDSLKADSNGVYEIEVKREYSVKTKGRNVPASEATYTMKYALAEAKNSSSLELSIDNSPDAYKDPIVAVLRSSYTLAILDSTDDTRKIEIDLNDANPQKQEWTLDPSSAFPCIKASFPGKASSPENTEVDIHPLLHDRKNKTITGTLKKEVSIPMLKGFVVNDAQ